MASDEARKKWGTIFMGDREASVEQLNAMQEHINRDKLQKERTEDYMERVKARAADRAREILGAAYEERQKVLEEAKNDAAVQKRLAAQECARMKGEAEAIRKQAEEELGAAQAQKDEAVKIREQAHEEGYQAGLNQAGAELHEFRAELGQSLSAVLRAIERERKAILENWREDLADLVKIAAQAGTGFVLQKEHEGIIRQLVFQALELLENRSVVSLRVNPADEETISDLFHAARERAPELKQWVVTGDDAIERGGLVADSGTGSVDFKRANFREMVDGVLSHLGLPELEREANESREVASLVEQEVARLAELTPELAPPEPEPVMEEIEPEATQPQPEETDPLKPEGEASAEEQIDSDLDIEAESDQEEFNEEPIQADTQPMPAPESIAAQSLAELEEELFPLDEEPFQEGPETRTAQAEDVAEPAREPALDPRTLSEGGFL